MAEAFTGGCLCGAVRYTATAPINQRICHCRLCQRAIGAAFNARVLVRVADVTLQGRVATRNSSDALERGFCPDCGTTLFSRRPAAGLMGLTTGSLDDPSLFAPEMHIWTSAKQPWVVIDDGLPQYLQAPPA